MLWAHQRALTRVKRVLLPYISTVFFLSMPLLCFAESLHFQGNGVTNYGTWSAKAVLNQVIFNPGDDLSIQSVLTLSGRYLEPIMRAGLRPDHFIVLATAERTFEPSGRQRLAGNHLLSTLLTPAGLPIEGGVFGAVTDRFGAHYRTPIDLLVTLPIRGHGAAKTTPHVVKFEMETRVPDDIPPGVYRIRLDYGFSAAGESFSLNREAFGTRSAYAASSYHYSPLLRVNGADVHGRRVDAAKIQPRIPWVLLLDYNSNGYRGVVAEEDKDWFGISGRNLIQDDVVLPRMDDKGRELSYSLEPRFIADTIDDHAKIPWNHTSGQLSIAVTAPGGETFDLGTADFAGEHDGWPSTLNPQFISWHPPSDGPYQVHATGWIEDTAGNRYVGGGTYKFWIANRLTIATASFPGTAHPVGYSYGHPIRFIPSVPATVKVTATLYRDSDREQAHTEISSGRATESGRFGVAEGMKRLVFDAPGEYSAHILGTYRDSEGQLWVGTMRHAGVVYPEDSPVVARGKKLYVDGEFVDRGETGREGGGLVMREELRNMLSRSGGTGEYFPEYLNYPYRSGDVLLIASSQRAANSIVPGLTVEWKDQPRPYDPRFRNVEASNLRSQTSNGLSPQLFPEYIDEWAYFYAAAPRPGFMSRFLVAEDGVQTPYWPVSPNSFGNQINASMNGDLPGDLYRLVGGTVVRRSGAPAAYAGYLASAFILPKDTNNNRIIAPGAEDVIGPDGNKARFWLTGPRPGLLYQVDEAMVPAVQVDPVLPATIEVALFYPDGRVRHATGVAGPTGIFVGSELWALDIPGVYRLSIEGKWKGHKGRMPGLPPGGGYLYVVEKDRPIDAPALHIELPTQSTFDPRTGTEICGSTTARSVHFAAVIPGAVIDQGDLPVSNGRFCYGLDPRKITGETPTYDTVNLISSRPEVKDVIHLSFFSRESTRKGVPYHSFVRLIIRGNQILYTR